LISRSAVPGCAQVSGFMHLARRWGFCDTAGDRLRCTVAYSRIRLPQKPYPEPSPLSSRSRSLLRANPTKDA
jgi:hypothetical protein